MKMPVGELETRYKERPAGSTSKLNTYRDGLRILKTIVRLVQRERPLMFFTGCSALLALLAAGLFAPVLATYLETGLVPRLPTVVGITGLVLLAMLSFITGMILDTVTRGRQEAKRMAYLATPAPDFDRIG
jgi:hypothetical protein